MQLLAPQRSHFTPGHPIPFVASSPSRPSASIPPGLPSRSNPAREEKNKTTASFYRIHTRYLLHPQVRKAVRSRLPPQRRTNQTADRRIRRANRFAVESAPAEAAAQAAQHHYSPRQVAATSSKAPQNPPPPPRPAQPYSRICHPSPPPPPAPPQRVSRYPIHQFCDSIVFARNSPVSVAIKPSIFFFPFPSFSAGAIVLAALPQASIPSSNRRWRFVDFSFLFFFRGLLLLVDYYRCVVGCPVRSLVVVVVPVPSQNLQLLAPSPKPTTPG